MRESNTRPRVVSAQILPLGERTKVGVTYLGMFQVWDGRGWGKIYKGSEFRAVKDLTFSELAGINLETWKKEGIEFFSTMNDPSTKAARNAAYGKFAEPSNE